MKKTLMAVAVAGALAAPAVVMAQSSTVQIYGTITYEYGTGDQGQNRPSVDYADTPGGSAIGFRGEEKLGGGLSAWFQCESSADVRAMDQTGWCTRNSAVGFKGGFGNLHFGRWDTPMKRALNMGTVGAEETGLQGMSFLPFGGSGGADATGTGPDAPNRQRWKRREAALSYYESPNFNGFQVLAAFSSGNAAADLPAVDATVNPKPRIWSLAGTYGSGPLAIGLGYERHDQFGAHQAGATARLDDRAWGIAAAYTFMGNLKVGFTYLDADYETGIGASMSKRTWTIGTDWRFSGPHSLHAQYARADDTKGNSTTTIGGNGGITSPATLVAGVVTPRSDTGGDAWSLAYEYAFSKRTAVRLAYVRVDNDTNTASYRIGNTAALSAPAAPAVGTANGQNVDSIAFRIKHRF
jgi:predicted porin